MKIVFTALLLFSFLIETYGQNQEAELILYNVGFGGITSGVGVMINNKKDKKIITSFWTGFKCGCIGGGITYVGKKISYQINNNKQLLCARPSKIVHGYGASTIENAAKAEAKVFNKLSFPIGFIRFNFEVEKNLKLYAQVQPVSVYSFIYQLTRSKSLAGKLCYQEHLFSDIVITMV